LPANSKIHPIFHCSLLKLHVDPLTIPSSPLPLMAQENNLVIEPLAMLDSKRDTTTDPPTNMVLVQWLGLAPEDASWEVWEELRNTFHLEDKVTLHDAAMLAKSVQPCNLAIGLVLI
ncbi:hypothetical protein V8G54_002940, partial [Vigna mungo]